MKSNTPACWLHWVSTGKVPSVLWSKVGSEFMVTEISPPPEVSGCQEEGERWLDSITLDTLRGWMNLKYDQVWMEEWSESQKQLLQLAKCLNDLLHRTNAESSCAGKLLKLYLDIIWWGFFHKLLEEGKGNDLRCQQHLVRDLWNPNPYSVIFVSESLMCSRFPSPWEESWGK